MASAVFLIDLLPVHVVVEDVVCPVAAGSSSNTGDSSSGSGSGDGSSSYSGSSSGCCASCAVNGCCVCY